MTSKEKLIEYFEQVITPERKNRIDNVLDLRTRYITVVLEDIFQSHNISAVLRSCDCFGINDVHIIKNEYEFNYNKEIGVGSYNWLTIIRHNKYNYNTLNTIKYLKSKGYRIIASSPHSNNKLIDDFDITLSPVALFFGTELSGLSNDVIKNCDEFIKIPMYGFTESFNISVSVAIILHVLYSKLIKSEINWHLTKQEKQEIKLQWLRNSIKKSDILENEFFNKNK